MIVFHGTGQPQWEAVARRGYLEPTVPSDVAALRCQALLERGIVGLADPAVNPTYERAVYFAENAEAAALYAATDPKRLRNADGGWTINVASRAGVVLGCEFADAEVGCPGDLVPGPSFRTERELIYPHRVPANDLFIVAKIRRGYPPIDELQRTAHAAYLGPPEVRYEEVIRRNQMPPPTRAQLNCRQAKLEAQFVRLSRAGRRDEAAGVRRQLVLLMKSNAYISAE